MFHDDIGKDAAAYEKFGGEAQVSWLQDGGQVIDDTIRDGLMESALIPVRPDVKFKALELDTFFIRDVVEDQGGEIRLTCLWTEAGKLRNFHVNMVISRRCGVGEDFQFFCGTTGHSLISVKSVRMVCSQVDLSGVALRLYFGAAQL